jgi:hypothetical protein
LCSNGQSILFELDEANAGINVFTAGGWTGEPREKYYELRGWSKKSV